jgi:hypothetical protein
MRQRSRTVLNRLQTALSGLTGQIGIRRADTAPPLGSDSQTLGEVGVAVAAAGAMGHTGLAVEALWFEFEDFLRNNVLEVHAELCRRQMVRPLIPPLALLLTLFCVGASGGDRCAALSASGAAGTP